MKGTIEINNFPKKEKSGYAVCRLNIGALWFWGIFDTKEAADRCAEQFENGVVVYVDTEGDKE